VVPLPVDAAVAPPERPAPTAEAASPLSVVAPVAATTVAEAALPTAATTPEPAQPTSAATQSEESLPPPAFTAQNSGRHTYKVIFTKNGNSNQGKASVQWQQDGEKYALSMSASLLFIEVFAWKSIGLLSPTGLLPERFSDKRYRKSEVAAHFDRTQGKITFSANRPEATLLAGAQDRISVIWQIAGMLSADAKRYPPGNRFSLQTVSATDAEPWLFTVNEPETLNLEMGSQIAQRLTRNPRREFDQKIELWFVPAMNYLPARFRFTETNGDYVDVVWQSVDNLPNTVSP
jgi:dipeptidyl aminopeptidase/acylaminoacyl peptidase